MLAAIIKICWYAHLSQLYSFVENKMQQLPNPAVYLHNETPNGPSSQMVLFLLEGKNGNQNYLYLNFMISFYVSLESHTVAYCTFALVKMGVIRRPDWQRPALIIYMAPLETTEALVVHTQWGHLGPCSLVGLSMLINSWEDGCLVLFVLKRQWVERGGGKNNFNKCRVMYHHQPTCEGLSRGGR